MPDTIPRPDATPDPIAFLAPGGAPALTEEMMDVWICGFNAWTDYLTRMSGAVTPAAVMDANSRLMEHGLELFSRATALRLQHLGVSGPLLSDV